MKGLEPENCSLVPLHSAESERCVWRGESQCFLCIPSSLLEGNRFCRSAQARLSLKGTTRSPRLIRHAGCFHWGQIFKSPRRQESSLQLIFVAANSPRAIFLDLIHSCIGTRENGDSATSHVGETVAKTQLSAQRTEAADLQNPSAARRTGVSPRALPRRFPLASGEISTQPRTELLKKWFVVSDWIDRLFPEFLFPSFSHYTPPPDGRGHLLAPTIIVPANGNTLAAAFPGGHLIYLLDKRLEFSEGQGGKKIKISLRLTAEKMRACMRTRRMFELSVYKAID